MMRELLDAFWSPRFWLPPNTTWADAAPGSNGSVSNADHRDLLYAIPMAFGLLGLRFVLIRNFFKPLWVWLAPKDKLFKKAPENIDNVQLETAYRSSSSINDDRLLSLSKQTDLSRLQVERWWRKRHNRDSPTKLTKFCESSWEFVFGLHMIIFGIYILWDKDWFWDVEECFIGYPHQGLTDDIWWYYMVTIASYLSLIINQFTDVRRKNFWEMFIHHQLAAYLLIFSFICNFHRIGTIINFVTAVDILLEASKMAVYTGYYYVAECLFVCFTIVWLVHLGFLAFYSVWSMFILLPKHIPLFPVVYVFDCLLILLFILTLYWTKTIVHIALLRKHSKDPRISVSQLSEDSSLDDDQITSSPTASTSTGA